jgi:flagellin
MGLSVNSNIAAMNAYRNLSVTNNSMSKSLEKLSSGYRINRAADDAAGLAISEGLKSQIGGLTVAVRNTQDGISVVQTAEGALTETHSILQRMRDLSVQASNSGSTNTNALQNIQSEIGQLKSELDRISGTTNFNGQNLLDGSYNKTFQVGANAGQTISVSIGAPGKGMDSTGLGVAGVDVTKVGTYGSSAVTVATAAADATAAVLQITKQGTDDFGAASGTVASFKNLTGTLNFGGKTFDLGSVDYTSSTTQAQALTALNTAAKAALGLTTNPFAASGSDLTFKVQDAIANFTGTGGVALGTTPSAAQIDNATATFSPATGASAAIKALDTAIGGVSTQRANLGAVQNRFEHTINNLNVAVENLSASESRIRDTDMAQEMTNFTRAQILTQAGTAMLAQANQAPQSILKLLG